MATHGGSSGPPSPTPEDLREGTFGDPRGARCCVERSTVDASAFDLGLVGRIVLVCAHTSLAIFGADHVFSVAAATPAVMVDRRRREALRERALQRLRAARPDIGSTLAA